MFVNQSRSRNTVRPAKVRLLLAGAAALLVSGGVAAALIIFFINRNQPAPQPPPEQPPVTTGKTDRQKMAVLAEQKAHVSRANGGTVELPNGARVVIPADALPADTDVRVQQLRDPGLDPTSATMTDVDVGGATLAAPAKVTLPCPEWHKGTAKEGDYKVYRHHGDKVVEVPGRYDPERHVMEVESREFSLLLVIGAAATVFLAWWLWGPGVSMTTEADFRAALPPNKIPPSMVSSAPKVTPQTTARAVPYYPQGRAEWCWAASAQMVLKAYNSDREIWDLGRLNNESTDEGLNALKDHCTGLLSGYFQDQGLLVEYNNVPFKNHWVSAGYLVSQLSQGRPVWLSVLAQHHVIVAVGFSDQGLYVHDPSGAITSQVNMLSANRVAELISWSDYYTLCNSGLPDWVHYMVVTSPPPPPALAASPVSITLMQGRLHFEHPRAPWDAENPAIAKFTWDGRVPLGYKFEALINAPKVFPEHATNSDRFKLGVDLANSGPDNASVEVTATLGDLSLGKVVGSVTSGDYSHTINLTKSGELAPLPGRFKPGRYPLKIVAKVGGREVDKIDLQVDVGPSQVPNVRFETKDKDTWLCWDKVAEDGCAYAIFLSGPTPGPGDKRTTQDQLKWRVDTDLLNQKESKWLYVVARHADSGLSGPPSAWLPLQKPTEPELIATLLYPMSDAKTAPVKVDPSDRKLWATWRYTNKGAIIRIDNEEMELTSGGDLLRYVDRGVNGTSVQAHAKGAKIYLIKAAPDK